jgi:phage terminase small subunit
MSRGRTATNVLNARDAFKKHPERRREDPEPTGPFPADPPVHLSEAQAACWRELVRIAPAGVLFLSDQVMVELCAVLLAQFREEQTTMPPPMFAQLKMILGKLGLSPSDRAGLKVPSARRNEFDDVA